MSNWNPRRRGKRLCQKTQTNKQKFGEMSENFLVLIKKKKSTQRLIQADYPQGKLHIDTSYSE